VTARIFQGATSLTPTRYAIRCARTRVLPEPAPARISSGPSVVVTARACSGLRRRMISSARCCRAAARAVSWAALAAASAGGAGASAGPGASRSQSGSSGVPAVPAATSLNWVPTVAAASSDGRAEGRRRDVGLTCSFYSAALARYVLRACSESSRPAAACAVAGLFRRFRWRR
jgi:hypothetical protein